MKMVHILIYSTRVLDYQKNRRKLNIQDACKDKNAVNIILISQRNIDLILYYCFKAKTVEHVLDRYKTASSD